MDYSEYTPGICNIGPAEIAARKKVGWIGFILTVVVSVLFIYLDVSRVWRLLLFFPSAMWAIGFLQGKMHFCVAFGMGHLFNLGPQVGKTESVLQAEFRAKDRKKAWQIISYSLLIGMVAALAAYLL